MFLVVFFDHLKTGLFCLVLKCAREFHSPLYSSPHCRNIRTKQWSQIISAIFPKNIRKVIFFPPVFKCPLVFKWHVNQSFEDQTIWIWDSNLSSIIMFLLIKCLVFQSRLSLRVLRIYANLAVRKFYKPKQLWLASSWF